jgi:hypothetical protein
MELKTIQPKERVNKDERIYTLEHYYLSLDWWSRWGHFNESLYRKIVEAKRSQESMK